MDYRVPMLKSLAIASVLAMVLPANAQKPEYNPAPTAKDWSDLAKLPDWSGVWIPDLADQTRQWQENKTPWTAKAAKDIADMNAAEAAGKPSGLFNNCLPLGMPSWMLMSHSAMEILFTPGRITMLGELDGNRLRRIYTDGRPHPNDPDITFHGNSIGHWEGDTLVVDTIGILPEVMVAVSEGAGIPNGGDMRIVERIHLVEPNTLHVDLEITAPHILTAPWKTTRVFNRQRVRAFDIVEGVCLQGSFVDQVDEHGNAVFVPIPAEKQ
jgi:hypothetical protein